MVRLWGKGELLTACLPHMGHLQFRTAECFSCAAKTLRRPVGWGDFEFVAQSSCFIFLGGGLFSMFGWSFYLGFSKPSLTIFGPRLTPQSAFFAILSFLFSLLQSHVMLLASFFCLSAEFNVCMCECLDRRLYCSALPELILYAAGCRALAVLVATPSGFSSMQWLFHSTWLSVNVSQEETRGDSKLTEDEIHWFKCSLERKWKMGEEEWENSQLLAYQQQYHRSVRIKCPLRSCGFGLCMLASTLLDLYTCMGLWCKGCAVACVCVSLASQQRIAKLWILATFLNSDIQGEHLSPCASINHNIQSFFSSVMKTSEVATGS